MAERAIVEELSASPLADMEFVEITAITSRVSTRLRVEPWPVPAGFYDLRPDPNFIKMQRATREALQRLHASGVLVAFGTPEQNENLIRFSVRHNYGDDGAGEVYLPSTYTKYHLATPYRSGQRFRLASGDVYLSFLDQSRLPSRAKRCLKESVEAFKKRLYLSATVGVGAASENLWMSFGRLVLSKQLPGYPKLDGLFFKKGYPNVGEILKQTWNILISECNSELQQIFPMRGEQDAFKSYADGVLELRNYALHNEDADEDEARFTYDETGLLLIRAVNYFNQLMRLMEAVDKKP